MQRIELEEEEVASAAAAAVGDDFLLSVSMSHATSPSNSLLYYLSYTLPWTHFLSFFLSYA